ncbi:MAG: CinA family nicotinamide mononucleotide deamidase-related protein [Edaphocola sp.]
MSYAAIIVTIGDELLIGQTIDTNSAWIAQHLNKLGINVTRRIAIADTQEAIAAMLDESIPMARLVILTGGLGPTADDVTKPALNNYFGGNMVVNETVLEHVRQIFAKRNRPFLEANLKQAEVPDACTVLFNRMGTAPGMWFEKGDTIIVSLPGVPFEMETIMTEEALPRIQALFKGNYMVHKTLVTAGVGESFLAEKIKDIETALPKEIHLAYLPGLGFVKLRLTGESADGQALQSSIATHSQLLVQRLGNVVASEEDETLANIVAKKLLEHRLTFGTAESCTGGYLGSLLTNIAGSSAFYKGSVVGYANETKEAVLKVSAQTLETEGAVSEATVIQMAEHARSLLCTDIAVATSGILGPDGGTAHKPVGTVWMAVSNGKRTVAKLHQFHYDRLRNKEMAANAAFNLVRLFIEANYG